MLWQYSQVVDWAIKAESRIGYFAALYKRITLAIQDAMRGCVRRR